MSVYKRNGVPQWRPRQGEVSRITSNRRAALVRSGKASFWIGLRSIDDAIKHAGI